MPTHKKAHDKDKYYHLAKDQGYRSRAAFKLIQINKRFNILNKARVCIDLCAAPGGWCQVAAKTMLKGSIVLGVDLLPIRSIRDVKTIVADITTAECRRMIKEELQGWKADVVLCDGAPNIGSAYKKDAYVQNELVLAALRTATDHLVEKGCFVTKVYRSIDYNALIWVFNQLFEEVQAMKPNSSRSQSAEIFIICQGYTNPKTIDPKLLDPDYVFRDISSTDKPAGSSNAAATVSTGDATVDVMHKKYDQHNKRHRSGYDLDTLGPLLTRSLSVADFVRCPDPVRKLTDFHELLFSDAESLKYKDHKLTTVEMKTCFADLRLLGKIDFKKILKWRQAMIKWEEAEAKEATGEGEMDIEGGSDAEEEGGEPEPETEEQRELRLQSEIEELQQSAAANARKLKKKQRENLAKSRQRSALGMNYKSFDAAQDTELFSLANSEATTLSVMDEIVKAGGRRHRATAEDAEEDGSDTDSDFDGSDDDEDGIDIFATDSEDEDVTEEQREHDLRMGMHTGNRGEIFLPNSTDADLEDELEADYSRHVERKQSKYELKKQLEREKKLKGKNSKTEEDDERKEAKTMSIKEQRLQKTSEAKIKARASADDEMYNQDEEDDEVEEEEEEEGQLEQVPVFTAKELDGLSRKELQVLAKEHGVQTSGSSETIMAALLELMEEPEDEEEEDEEEEEEEEEVVTVEKREGEKPSRPQQKPLTEAELAELESFEEKISGGKKQKLKAPATDKVGKGAKDKSMLSVDAPAPMSVKAAQWFSNPVFGAAGASGTSGSLLPPAPLEDEGDHGDDKEGEQNQMQIVEASADKGKKNKKGKKRAAEEGDDEDTPFTVEQMLAKMPKTDKLVRHEKRLKEMERKARKDEKKAVIRNTLMEAEENDRLMGTTVKIVSNDADVGPVVAGGLLKEKDESILEQTQWKNIAEKRKLIQAGMGNLAPKMTGAGADEEGRKPIQYVSREELEEERRYGRKRGRHDGESDSDDDEEDNGHGRQSAKSRRRRAATAYASDSDSDDSDAGYDTETEEELMRRKDDRTYDSDSERYDHHDRARQLALGTMMLNKSRAKAMLDSSYNRFAWNDSKDLPSWFVDDEMRHNKPQIPVPNALLNQIKGRESTVSGPKEIKKVAEAHARKRRRAATKLKEAKKQANQVANNPEMSEKQKLRAIQKAMKGGKVDRPSKVYVVTQKTKGASSGTTMQNKAGKGGKLKFVDSRMKTDRRAERKNKKDAKRGRKKK